MMRRINNRLSKHADRSFVLLTGVLTILAYGLLIRQLGMYGDDPNFLWAYHRDGAAEYQRFMGWIREFGYLIYRFLSPLFGTNILPYRLSTIFLRWTACLLFYFSLKKSYPRQRTLIALASVCFLLYPGFSQMAIPVEFILHFLSLNAILLSIWLTQQAVAARKRSWAWLIPAILLEIFGLFTCEYFVGLEFLRPFLIRQLLMNQEDQAKKPGRLAAMLSPFAVVLVVFVLWRAFFSSITYLEPVLLGQLAENPLGTLWNLCQRAALDVKMTCVDAWLLIFRLPGKGKTLLGALLILLVTFILSWVYFRALQETEPMEGAASAEPTRLLALGAVILVLSGLPVWAAGLQMDLSLFWDRLTLSFMGGACLVLAAVSAAVLRRKYQPAFFALLIALMVGYQFQLQTQYPRDWQQIQRYFWELKWRAPDIEPNTILIGDQFPFTAITDNSLNALLNWNYEDPAQPAAEPYKFLQASARSGLLSQQENQETLQHNAFSGTLENSLVLYSTPSTCLKVLTQPDRGLPFLGVDLKNALPFSNLERILPAPSRTVGFEAFMGAEPPHGWCYHFEKAELLAQQGKWGDVLALGKEAESLSLKPTTVVELRPFLFAALIENDTETAERWADQVLAEKGNARYFSAWLRTLDGIELTPAAAQIVEKLKTSFDQEIAAE